jgi:hypothetical protein
MGNITWHTAVCHEPPCQGTGDSDGVEERVAQALAMATCPHGFPILFVILLGIGWLARGW